MSGVAKFRLKSASPLAINSAWITPRFRHDVVDLGKAFRAQQLLGDILGRDADTRNLD